MPEPLLQPPLPELLPEPLSKLLELLARETPLRETPAHALASWLRARAWTLPFWEPEPLLAPPAHRLSLHGSRVPLIIQAASAPAPYSALVAQPSHLDPIAQPSHLHPIARIRLPAPHTRGPRRQQLLSGPPPPHLRWRGGALPPYLAVSYERSRGTA